MEVGECGELVGEFENGVAAEIEDLEVGELAQLGWDDADAVAAEVELLEVGELCYFWGNGVDEVAAEVETTEVAHFEDLRWYLFEAFEAELEDVDGVGVADVFEGFVDAVGLSPGEREETAEEEEEGEGFKGRHN